MLCFVFHFHKLYTQSYSNIYSIRQIGLRDINFYESVHVYYTVKSYSGQKSASILRYAHIYVSAHTHFPSIKLS